MRPLLPLLIAVSIGVSHLAAQGMGGRGGIGGPRPMMGGRRPQELPSQDLLRGPYAPDSMTSKFRLDSTQAERYRAAWDSTMSATRPARDSALEAMGDLRRARGEGGVVSRN